MRVFLGLIAVFALVLALLVSRLVPRPAARPAREIAIAPTEERDQVDEAPRFEPVRTPPRVRPAPERRARVVVEGVADLRGIVVGGDDDNDGDDDGIDRELSVVADDGKREFRARIVDDRRFVLRVPPRTYSLTARSGERIGRLHGVRATNGDNGELVIRLEATATIAGAVRGGGDRKDSVVVRAYRAGTTLSEDWAELGPDDTFALTSLVDGGRYDLVVSDDFGLNLRLPAVLAPTSGVIFDLPTLPVLRGAVGVTPGDTCDNHSVSITGEDDFSASAAVNADCRFESTVQSGMDVVVTVSTDGAHYEARVPIPATGDPDFVCLNPPCDPPLLATLALSVEGSPCAKSGHAVLLNAKGHRRGCRLSDGRCQMENLPVGSPLAFHMMCPCTPDRDQVSLGAGYNVITLRCLAKHPVDELVRHVPRSDASVP